MHHVLAGAAIHASFALLAIPMQSAPTPPQAEAPRASRVRPLTVEDALFSIPDVVGEMRLVGDLDGDGRDDLVVVRGDRKRVPGTPTRIEAVSAVDGHTIRVLWRAPAPEQSAERAAAHPTPRPRPVVFDWDAGGDVDGDRVPDLVVGLPEGGANGERSGIVVVVSGASGEVVHTTHGALPLAHHGWSVAFAGDVDGDGRDDYAVGVPQCDPRHLPPPDSPQRGGSMSSTGDEQPTYWVHLEDGRRIEQTAFWQEHLGRRSELCGYVSLRSGRDGSESWRVEGSRPGHAFGTRVRAAGDVDRDGHIDLLVAPDRRSSGPIVAVSGATARTLRELENSGGPFGLAGDVDGDGASDVHFDRMDSYRNARSGAVALVSGSLQRRLFELAYPDWWSEYAVTVPLGDVDGDGAADLLLGDGNFHIPGPGDGKVWSGTREAPDLASLTLDAALALESEPWCAMTWESGAAWVYSGRTRRVIMGVWGAPGSRQGMGLYGAPIPDLDGDGLAEIAVVDATGAHVFAGPGRSPASDARR